RQATHRRNRSAYSVEAAGRWSLLPQAEARAWDEETLESLIQVYMQRWGVLSRQILSRETAAPPWRELLPVLRRMELRGMLRGGRFIEGLGGEQFALPDFVRPLREQAQAL